MIRLTVQKANELERNVKATVQSTGRLGFSDGAKKKMNLNEKKFVVIATNDEDKTDENLYAWVEESGDGGGFKVNKGGEYFNINTKPLFDKLKLDYKGKDRLVIYDIVDFDNDGQNIFKLIKRVVTRNKNKKTGAVDS
jgi:hypothetical protein